MRNLLPLEAYRIDETGYWSRLPFVTTLGFGVPMGLAILLTTSELDWIARVLVAVVGGSIGGALFGILFPIVFRRQMFSYVDAVYQGRPGWAATDPPQGKEVHSRLPCGWSKNARMNVGGVLYVGKAGFVFVPHRRNLPGDRNAIEI